MSDTPSSAASGMGELADELRSTTEEMACTCSIPMELWQKHSTAVLRAADALSAKDRELAEAQRPEVRCDGCGSSWTEADLARERAANPNLLSCCPERKPLTIDQWKARADEALSALREKEEQVRALEEALRLTAGALQAGQHLMAPVVASTGEWAHLGKHRISDILDKADALLTPVSREQRGEEEGSDA